ncbi:phosphatase PAP2 family protein [Hydrocarboniphaga sp.]|uniref:phosphatase PAP2 family protein n=1 Tax=Hydrocarboniphaga sp. TaxID=2033016 RepID=UPI003D10B6B8
MNPELLRRLWVTPALLLLALLFQQMHWDWLVTDHFFDYVDSRFPMRGLWWSDGLLHDGGTMIVAGIASVSLIALVASYRIARLRPLRGDFAYLLACIALTTGVVALIKSVSGIHCPVELARYGGRFHYEALIDRLLRPVVGEGRPGACFPGGHSSGGLSLLALYFLALHHRWAYAPRVLMATVAIGFVFALTQWIRGAHFPSHDLTTAAIAWAICLLLAATRRRLPTMPAVAAPPEHANIVGS